MHMRRIETHSQICAANGAYIPKIKKLYPRLRWGLVSNPQNEAAQATMDREGCDGVIGTINLFHTWRTDVAFCKFSFLVNILWPVRFSPNQCGLRNLGF